MSQDRTEKPTAKKRKESRKEGQVPRTQELGSWAAMLVAGVALPLLVSRELESLSRLLIRALRSAEDPTVPHALALLGDGARHALIALVLLGSGVMVVSVAGAISQGGFYLATKAVRPKAAKLNPINGAKRMFGPQALWEGAKVILKSSVLAWFVYDAVRSLMPLLGGLVPIPVVLEAVTGDAVSLVRDISVAGLVLAAADYAMQRRRMGKQTRMTKEEVRQEHRQAEGDPLVKSAIRSRQLAMARSRMMADVPTADVLLVNPTHFAVALRYEPGRSAPRVVARGAGLVAQRVREVATEAGVPVVRDIPLARALYTSTSVGQEIPPELFAAVAQVLAFVIGRRNLGLVGGEHRSPRPVAELPAVPRGGGRRHKGSASPASGR